MLYLTRFLTGQNDGRFLLLCVFVSIVCLIFQSYHGKPVCLKLQVPLFNFYWFVIERTFISFMTLIQSWCFLCDYLCGCKNTFLPVSVTALQ